MVFREREADHRRRRRRRRVGRRRRRAFVGGAGAQLLLHSQQPEQACVDQPHFLFHGSLCPRHQPSHLFTTAGAPPVHCESQLKQVLQHLPAIQRCFLMSHFPQLFCCAHVCLPSGGTSLQLGTASKTVSQHVRHSAKQTVTAESSITPPTPNMMDAGFHDGCMGTEQCAGLVVLLRLQSC